MVHTLFWRMWLVTWLCFPLLCFLVADDFPVDSSIDVSKLDRHLIYQPRFSEMPHIIYDEHLENNNVPADLPAQADWVQEGPGRVWSDNGTLSFQAGTFDDSTADMFLWSTRRLPHFFLLEFQLLNISAAQQDILLFFAATGEDNGSIFDVNQPPRKGRLENYYYGSLNCYTLSIRSTSSGSGRTGVAVSLWQNYGKQSLAENVIYIKKESAAVSLRLLKHDTGINFFIANKPALRWPGDGNTLGSGYLGFGIPHQTHTVRISNLSIWQVY